MRRWYLLILCLLLAVSLTGCIKTYTYQLDRKDQAITGNRGYIMGKVPQPEEDRKCTRTIAGVDIKLPPTTSYKTQKRALKKEKSVARETEGKSVVETEPMHAEPKKGFADEQWVKEKEAYPTEVPIKTAPAAWIPTPQKYTVQEHDTLEKIAKKFYGRVSKWPAIYEANKNVIKDPSKIRPGQVLIIPQAVAEEKIIEESNK